MQNIEQGKVVGEGTGVERCAVLKARTARISGHCPIHVCIHNFRSCSILCRSSSVCDNLIYGMSHITLLSFGHHLPAHLVPLTKKSAGIPFAAAANACADADAYVDAVANNVFCKQGWLLGTWLTAQKDIKATIQEVMQYLTDGVIVPESGAQLFELHQLACLSSVAMPRVHIAEFQLPSQNPSPHPTLPAMQPSKPPPPYHTSLQCNTLQCVVCSCPLSCLFQLIS